MKTTAFILSLLILSLNSCNKKTNEWTILYGELNDNLAYHEAQGNYYYDNIEYFFINNKTQTCYRNVDTNQLCFANSLIKGKLAQLNSNKIDNKVFKEATISTRKQDYINIEFADKEGRNTLYKINLADTLNDNVFVYTKNNNDFIETIWTDRKSRSRKTKKFLKAELN